MGAASVSRVPGIHCLPVALCTQLLFASFGMDQELGPETRPWPPPPPPHVPKQKWRQVAPASAKPDGSHREGHEEAKC